jgi:pyruvate/2-oxoglutarate/acetoin dehydrogenase E1 component
MAISIVNGYFCASSCDVAKAKKGEDPHPSTEPGNLDGKDRKAFRSNDPAVLFGGALGAQLSAETVKHADGTQPADSASTRRTGQTVDVLA